MKHIVFTILVVFGLMIVSSTGFTEENLWEKDFIAALVKGKADQSNQSGGLGYTPAESVVLENAIKEAMELKAPACNAMKIAVDLEYNPYAVIKNIYGYGGGVDLDQLCMCATESGINKQIIAKAATDAVSPLGTPVFSRDEIVQAQCLNTPPRVTTEHQIPVSAEAPGSQTKPPEKS